MYTKQIKVYVSTKSIGLHLNVYGFDDRRSLHVIYTYNLINKANLVHNFFQYVHFFSLHISGISGDYVPIIRRNNCIYATIVICHSVWMNVWYAGFIPENHPHRVTNTKCRIDTVTSQDDGHIAAQNVQKKEINILGKILHQFGFIYKIIQGCAVNKIQTFYVSYTHILTDSVLL